MQIQQLAYFVAVAETRQFTRAAARMKVAQPSLSQQIRALEDDLDARLFDRLPTGVGLTVAGEQLLPIARRILAEVDTARRVINDLADLNRGQVRLGATPSLCTGLIPPMLAAFHRAHPGIRLQITESSSRDLQRLLTQGALDLALVVDSRATEDARLAVRPLYTEELVVISRHDLLFAGGRPRVDITELRDQPLVMFREGYDLRESTVSACRDAGFEPSFAIEGGELDAVLELVAVGIGVAVVPSTVVGDRFHVTRFDSPGLSRTVLSARRSGAEPPRSVLALEETVTRFLADEALDSLPLLRVHTPD